MAAYLVTICIAKEPITVISDFQMVVKASFGKELCAFLRYLLYFIQTTK